MLGTAVMLGASFGPDSPRARGFLIYPAQLPEPAEIVGAEALHTVLRGWLTHLGHPEPARDDSAADSLTG
jgi:hypothetical protein